MAQTKHGRTPRSRSDRTAIEPRSHVFRRGTYSTRADEDRRSSRITIDARSWPDRGAILARSRRDRGPIVVRSWQKFEAVRPLNPVKIVAELKPRPRQVEPLPRPLQNAATTAPMTHDPRANFPL